MNEQKTRRSELGRGLSALLGDAGGRDDAGGQSDFAAAGREPHVLPIAHLHPSRLQPRRNFGEEDINSLAESVREQGILQPILVRRDPDAPDSYEIVAGERRWRAAQAAQLHQVPVIVRDLTDHGVLEIALVENIQRKDLNPLEEAEGYRRLIDEFSHRQADLARAVGKSRSQIANTLRLLNLPDAVKALLENGALTAGHARALLNADDPEGLAGKVVSQGLNVRQTEKLAQRGKNGAAKPRAAHAKDPDTVALERGLTNVLGLKASIDFDGEGGRLIIRYRNLDQLDDLLQRLSRSPDGGARAEWRKA